MKRPPQLWVVIIGIVCAWVLPNALGLRATSLIFAKTSTTTSTTEAPAEESTTVSSSSENSADNQTVTKPPLTGIPQIDYVHDPNLPFELNGANLSNYPFYDRVPEDIDFKCDGLHDGFYASIPHRCQVYHHCLYGTRYDFLCANFTAFDQTTFICHFVSEVDCDNSKKFWHRNDALYQAASTTAAPTTTILPITPSPALNPALRRPIASLGGLAGRRRRPLRRRPAYDYYDDELYDYEERPRGRERDRDHDDYYDDPPPRSSGSRRRKRPRPNRRPIEYDEEEEYEDERFDRRPVRRDEDRRPYRDDDRRYDDRRPSSKNKDRKVEDDEEDRSTDRRKTEDRRIPADDDNDRRANDRPRKPSRDRFEDDKDDDRTDRRPYNRPRKTDDKNERRPIDRQRKPVEDEERRYRPKDQKTVSDDKEDRRTHERPKRPVDEERRYRPREKTEERIRTTEEPKVLIKPSGSSVYDRPRASPIIRRPVPKSERNKYDYKPPAADKPTPKSIPGDEEYYDDYEDEPKLPPPKPTRKPSTESEERRGSFTRPRRPPGPVKRPIEDVEEEKRPAPKRTQNRSLEKSQDRSQERSQERGRISYKEPVVEEEYADDYEEDKSSLRGESSREKERSSERTKLTSKENRETSSIKADPTTEENVSRERERRPEPIVKIVKRPFLPSRGGNPYAARGLQPVGAKALDVTTEIILKQEETLAEKSKQNQEEDLSSSYNKPQSEEEVYYDDEEDLKPVTTTKRPFLNLQPRTTPKPKVNDNFRNPLDITENEYDVTLNDALNPTLPNLPIRNVPTGFSSGRDGFITQNHQRPRLIAVDTPVLASANSDYVYVKQPTTRYNPYVAVQVNRQPYTTYQ